MPNHLSRRAFLGQMGTMAALAVANPPLWGKPTSPVPAHAVGWSYFSQVAMTPRSLPRSIAGWGTVRLTLPLWRSMIRTG